MNIKETIKKINDLIDGPDNKFASQEVMQLSQAALNLAKAAETLASLGKEI